MKQHTLKWAAVAAGTLATATCGTEVQAQAVDSLLDKLVDKGVLTTKEANDLRHDADKDFAKAYAAKSGMPDWVTAFKLNGDFRGRYEMFETGNDAFVDRNRFRYRLRFGAVANIKDNFEVGLRFSSSDPSGTFGGDPISGNSTLQDNASRKFVYLDLAYGKWTFLNTKEYSASVSIGKIENPFTVSDSVFDPDYDPEGAGANFTYRLNDHHTLKFNAGAFVLDELSGGHDDPWLYGAQVRWDAAWSKAVATTVGLAALNIVDGQSLTNGAVPNVQRGNTRDAGTGALSKHFNPIVVDAGITYSFEEAPCYKGPFPIKLAGEYMNNLAASDREQAFQGGITFGKAGKKGLWEVAYRYKYLGADSWYEEFTDSDYGAFYGGTLPNSGFGAGYGAGTNVRGHVAKVSYSPFDALTLSVTYLRTTLINEIPAGSNSDMTRLQVDALWKF